MNMNRSFPKSVPTPMAVTVLAEQVGDYLSLSGVEEKDIRSVASPRDGREGTLVFCTGVNLQKCQENVDKTKASVIVAAFQISTTQEQALILVEDPLAWYIKALNILFSPPLPPSIDPTAKIASGVAIGKRVTIGAGSVIEEGCHIGDDCLIGTNCYLGPGTLLEKNVFVQDHACIGGVGLGYHMTKNNERLFFPHLGVVIVGYDVVIGSGTVIVRGEMDDTIIGDRTRIGNLVNIGHNVVIGEDCAVSSSTCVAGGTTIGARCNIATGVTINAKMDIEDDCQIGLGSVVTKKVCSGQSVFGCPARLLPTMRRF